jgi:hypothetical protein
MSPLLFLLVAKCLSWLTLNTRSGGAIKDVRVVGSIFVSQLLFVDDILIFAQGSLKEINHYKSLLDIFLQRIRMEVNFTKSCILYNGLEDEMERRFSQAMPSS